MLTLAERADARTAVIPDEHTPSQAELADETGLGLATVKRHIETLTAEGWIVRDVPTEQGRARGERTRYRLAIGGQEATASTAHSDTSSTAHSELSSERAELTVIPEHGSERHQSTAQSEPSSYISDRNHQIDLTTGAADAADESDGALFPVAESKTPNAPKADPAERFSEFYKTYPRHIAPGRAEKAWIKAVKDGAQPQVIIEAAERFAAYCTRIRKETNWIPYPATWLNDHSWADEEEPQHGQQRPGQHTPWLDDPTDNRPYAGEL